MKGSVPIGRAKWWAMSLVPNMSVQLGHQDCALPNFEEYEVNRPPLVEEVYSIKVMLALTNGIPRTTTHKK